VNAAFNIATTPLRFSVPETLTELTAEEMRFTKKQLRRMNRAMKAKAPALPPAITSMGSDENMLGELL